MKMEFLYLFCKQFGSTLTRSLECDFSSRSSLMSDLEQSIYDLLLPFEYMKQVSSLQSLNSRFFQHSCFWFQ